jgi:transposase
VSPYYSLTVKKQRPRQPAELAVEWMRSVQQGTMPLNILEEELNYIKPEELRILLSAAARGELRLRNRSVGLLAYLRGAKADVISSFLEVNERTIFEWLKDFRQGGTTQLLTRKPRSDIKSNKEDLKQTVFSLLHSPPAPHGLIRTTWRLPDLKKVLREQFQTSISVPTISKIIKQGGWKWRHARIVLTSHDPEYRAKVDAITKILSELTEDEAFFSIDEYGPFAIKRKGGVKRVAPGEQYVIPQWQKSKGWLIVTAALELSRNQVSHLFSNKKNTEEMIRMAEHLRAEYRSCSTIYLSWDAASWHVSKELAAHLEKLNQQAKREGFPVVKTAPLPACAQFLNVIESVFSGMAKAIIHNSDYPSVEAAQAAIDRYFEERNNYFLRHPKKAGQKLWGKELVPSMFAEGQNCKDPMYQYQIG